MMPVALPVAPVNRNEGPVDVVPAGLGVVADVAELITVGPPRYGGMQAQAKANVAPVPVVVDGAPVNATITPPVAFGSLVQAE